MFETRSPECEQGYKCVGVNYHIKGAIIRLLGWEGLEFLNWRNYLFHFLFAELYFTVFYTPPQPKYLFQFVCGDKYLFHFLRHVRNYFLSTNMTKLDPKLGLVLAPTNSFVFTA